MNKYLEILLGLILLIVPLVVALGYPASWGKATLQFLEGGVVIGVMLIGLMFIILGISDLSA